VRERFISYLVWLYFNMNSGLTLYDSRFTCWYDLNHSFLDLFYFPQWHFSLPLNTLWKTGFLISLTFSCLLNILNTWIKWSLFLLCSSVSIPSFLSLPSSSPFELLCAVFFPLSIYLLWVKETKLELRIQSTASQMLHTAPKQP